MPNKVEENKHKSIKQREQLENYLTDWSEEGCKRRKEDIQKILNEKYEFNIDKKKKE